LWSAATSFTAWILTVLLLKDIRSPHARLLAVFFGVAWIPSLLAWTGTTHGSDLLFTAAILLVLWKYDLSRRSFIPWLLLGLLILLCALSRLTTFIMIFPAMIFLTLLHAKKPAAWIFFVLTLAAVFFAQSLVIALFGGWDVYTSSVRQMSTENALTTSFIHSGLTRGTAANMLRSLSWFLIQNSFLLLPVAGLVFLLAKRLIHQPRTQLARFRHSPMLTALGASLLISATCLFITTFYLATHPGYLAPTVVPICFMAAIALRLQYWRSRPWSLGLVLGFILIGTGAYQVMRPYLPPRNAREAILNGMLLQYSACGQAHNAYRPTAFWLRDVGRSDLVPAQRLKNTNSNYSGPE
jgi:hypothetical protein